MGVDLPSDQWVVGVNMVPFEAEDFFQAANQRLANFGHGGMPLAPSFHRGVPQRLPCRFPALRARRTGRGRARRSRSGHGRRSSG